VTLIPPPVPIGWLAQITVNILLIVLELILKSGRVMEQAEVTGLPMKQGLL
jgi:hypothetical protein